MKNLLLLVLSVVLAVSLSGCFPMPTWNKPGGTVEEFSRVKYQCLKEAQQRVSHAEQQGYNAVSDSQVATNETLFQSCMNAKGWFLGVVEQKPAPVERKTERPAAQAKPVVHQPATVETKKKVVEESTQRKVAEVKNPFIAKTKTNLRKGPSTNFKKLGALEKGDIVSVLAKKGAWYEIETAEGLIAWCSSSFLAAK